MLTNILRKTPLYTLIGVPVKSKYSSCMVGHVEWYVIMVLSCTIRILYSFSISINFKKNIHLMAFHANAKLTNSKNIH